MEHGHTSIKELSPKEWALMVLEVEESKEKALREKEQYLNETYILQDKICRANMMYGELSLKKERLDDFFNSKNGIPITTIAKELKLTAISLNKILGKLKIQFKKGKRWRLYHEHIDKGYAVISYSKDKNRKGETIVHDHMYWMQAGRKMIYEEIKRLRQSVEYRRKYGVTEKELRSGCHKKRNTLHL